MDYESFNVLTVFAVLPVKNLEESIAWYTKLFGRSPDHQPAPNVVDYYLSDDRDPRKGTLQLMVDSERAGGGLATVNVSSIDEVVRLLKERNIEINTVTIPINAEVASNVIVGTVDDPDGNALSIVQAN